jgi:hypothetical protein
MVLYGMVLLVWSVRQDQQHHTTPPNDFDCTLLHICFWYSIDTGPEDGL